MTDKRKNGDLAPEKVRQQQHTGNHDRSPGEDPDRFAGTRAGAENVEPAAPGKKR